MFFKIQLNQFCRSFFVCLSTCGNKVVDGVLPLQHHPHALHKVLGVAPVPAGVQVPDLEVVHLSMVDLGHGPGDLPGDERLAPSGTFVVEQDPVTREHPVGLSESRVKK